MTFGWKNANLNNLIKNYEILYNKIVIYYLDNTCKVLDYSKEIEEELQDKLFQQAKERQQNDTLKNIIESREKYALLSLVLNSSHSPSYNYLYTFDEKIQELKKYDIYLKMKDDLAESLKEGYPSLNINTLDNFTLREIELIKSNLERKEKNVIKSSKRKLYTK